MLRNESSLLDRGFARELLQLYTLSAFGVSQPLFDRLSGHVTYLLDHGLTRGSLILLADLIYVLVIAALVLARVVRLIADRRSKSAGSRLHLRLSGVFMLIALIPTVLVAVFAVLSINIGLEGWFSDRVRSVVGSSLSAAQAYEAVQRDDLASAEQHLKASILLEPENEAYQLTLAQAQLARNDPAAARRTLEALRRPYVPSPIRIHAEQMLREIGNHN